MVIFGRDVDDVVVVVAVVDSDAKPTSTDKLAVTTSEAIKLILSLNLMSYKNRAAGTLGSAKNGFFKFSLLSIISLLQHPVYLAH